MNVGEGLGKTERETIIIISDGSDEASVWTTSPVAARRLERRFKRKPDESHGRGCGWVVPKKWITLPRAKYAKKGKAPPPGPVRDLHVPPVEGQHEGPTQSPDQEGQG